MKVTEEERLRKKSEKQNGELYADCEKIRQRQTMERGAEVQSNQIHTSFVPLPTGGSLIKQLTGPVQPVATTSSAAINIHNQYRIESNADENMFT